MSIPKFDTQYFDFEQGTEEWFDVRKGIITASSVKSLTAAATKKYPNGLGAGARTIAKMVAYEKVTNFETELINSYYIDRGNELEPVARKIYNKKNGVRVKEVGFALVKEFSFGVSPDGLVKADGMTEYKCPKYNTHMDTLERQGADPEYIPQMQMQMLATGRKWCDFVSYCENDKFPENLRHLTFRVEADLEYQEFLFNRIMEFQLMVDYWTKMLLKK